MWTQTAEGHKLVQQLSREIVSHVAPEEEDMFDELVLEYFQDPRPPDPTADEKEDELGFGINDALIAVTPAAAAVVNAILNYVTGDLVKVARDETAEAVRGKIKVFFNKDKSDNEEPAQLTHEQLTEIRKIARKQAIKFGMTPEQAEKMADAMIGSLVLRKPFS